MNEQQENLHLLFNVLFDSGHALIYTSAFAQCPFLEEQHRATSLSQFWEGRSKRKELLNLKRNTTLTPNSGSHMQPVDAIPLVPNSESLENSARTNGGLIVPCKCLMG